MKPTYLLTILIALALCACSSDEGDVEATPSFLLQGTDARPTSWIAPDYSAYELTMSVQVQLGDTLAKFQSEQDLMCATIAGEVRAVTVPKSTMNEVYYPLTIAGNAGEQTIALQYYCARLSRIYTIQGWAVFDPSAAPTGDDDLYHPCFTATY
ncbi:MAG: hypothetical protein IJS89_04250 [Bacteroidaceae bacterium]|nr:hypothetical protein [Bacteroidaceae bacterium]